MFDLAVQRAKLETILGKELTNAYFAKLKRVFTYKNPITMREFNEEITKQFTIVEQLQAHNAYIKALYAEGLIIKDIVDINVNFQLANFTTHITPINSSIISSKIEDKTATNEYFLPDKNFIISRLQIHLYENNIQTAAPQVAEYVAKLCQIFLKNIITAMITRRKSYKLRDGHFQYGFGLPVVDPLIRNSNKIFDYTQLSGIDVEDDNFIPMMKPTIEAIEQQTLNTYACAGRKYSDERLTLRLLYDTLKDNPRIVGLDSIQSVNLLQLSLMLDD